MPIYEFYCDQCHTIFNFFARRVNTTKVPSCPRCHKRKLARQVSVFAVTGKASEDKGSEDLPLSEGQMEKAMQMLAGEADRLNEDDPRQAAQLMRRLTDMTGLNLSDGLQEALSRMEKGEDPEKIEAEMGDLLEDDDPFQLKGTRPRAGVADRRPPSRDETLYDL